MQISCSSTSTGKPQAKLCSGSAAAAHKAITTTRDKTRGETHNRIISGNNKITSGEETKIMDGECLHNKTTNGAPSRSPAGETKITDGTSHLPLNLEIKEETSGADKEWINNNLIWISSIQFFKE